jgi:glycosyltransferase involved in cell wall biosynthesis
VTRPGTTASGYVLVTAAYNEEAYIEALLRSVVQQTHPPVRWVVVSDGSTDGTDEIVGRYARQYAFIELRRIAEEHERDFQAQVNAINLGFRTLRDVQYDFIGNLDADISLEPTYFARLIEEFRTRPRLGLAGGMIYEPENGRFRYRKMNCPESVAHAVQLFRRECFEMLGGYMAMPYGGKTALGISRPVPSHLSKQ